jgi:hypothetical protein
MSSGFRLFRASTAKKSAGLFTESATADGLSAKSHKDIERDNDDQEHNEIMQRAQSIAVDSSALLASAPALQK